MLNPVYMPHSMRACRVLPVDHCIAAVAGVDPASGIHGLHPVMITRFHSDAVAILGSSTTVSYDTSNAVERVVNLNPGSRWVEGLGVIRR